MGTPMPSTVWQAAAEATTGQHAPKRIYLVGGTKTEDIDGCNLTQIYNPTNDTWTYGAPLQTPRFSLSVAIINDTIYAIGGSEMLSLPQTYTGSFERYIPTNYGMPDPSYQQNATPTEVPELTSVAAGAAIVMISLCLVFCRKRVEKPKKNKPKFRRKA
jgi:hypothetical protein